MSLTWEINLGQLVTLGIAVVASLSSFFSLRAQANTTQAETGKLSARLEAMGARVDSLASGITTGVADLRLHVASEYVRESDLKAVEDRIGKRLETVEHTVRGTSNQILQALAALRPLTPPAHRRADEQ